MKLAELKSLAEKATPGPWVGDEFEMTAPKASTLIRGNVRLVWADDYHMNEWDASYIAAANPQTILDLIAKVEGLSKALEILRKNSTCVWDGRVSGEALAQFGPDVPLGSGNKTEELK